jgi:hypothetical protein
MQHSSGEFGSMTRGCSELVGRGRAGEVPRINRVGMAEALRVPALHEMQGPVLFLEALLAPAVPGPSEVVTETTV